MEWLESAKQRVAVVLIFIHNFVHMQYDNYYTTSVLYHTSQVYVISCSGQSIINLYTEKEFQMLMFAALYVHEAKT